MAISQLQLKQIIKEEIRRAVNEARNPHEMAYKKAEQEANDFLAKIKQEETKLNDAKKDPEATEAEAIVLIEKDESLQAKLGGEVVKVIYVPGRIINLIVNLFLIQPIYKYQTLK